MNGGKAMNRKFLLAMIVLVMGLSLVQVQAQNVDLARIQWINNAPDPIADSADIYVNGALFVNSLHFRSATRYIEIPAGIAVQIAIAPGNSTDPAQSWFTYDANFLTGQSYIALFCGVSDPARFPANPNGKNTAFTLFITPLAREKSVNPTLVDIFSFNGAPDAAGINIIYRDHRNVVNNLSYSDITADYFSVPQNGWAILDVLNAPDRSCPIITARGGFWKLAGQTTLLFTSGFVNPPAPMTKRTLRLCMANLNGDVIAFDNLTQSNVQFIHNSADPQLAQVDLYLDGNLLKDDMDFRTATPFLTVPGNDSLSLGVAPHNSTSAADVIHKIPLMLLAGDSYVSIMAGVLDSSLFAPNPDKHSTLLTWYTQKSARETANWKKHFEFDVFHGVTDGPAVKVDYEFKGNDKTLFSSLPFGKFNGYEPIFPRAYEMSIETAAQPSPLHLSYKLDLSEFAGQVGVLFASGFLFPFANQNGPLVGLYLAFPDGSVLPLSVMAPLAKSVAPFEQETATTAWSMSTQLFDNYPNPFNPSTTISFALQQDGPITLRVFDVLGREVAELANGPATAGKHQFRFNANGLASGKYYFRLEAGNYVDTRMMTLIK